MTWPHGRRTGLYGPCALHARHVTGQTLFDIDKPVLLSQNRERYEQHVKNCKYCSGAMRTLRTAMWAAIGVAAVGIVTALVAAATCVVVSGTRGWQVGLGGFILRQLLSRCGSF
jgi:hypothetical protein